MNNKKFRVWDNNEKTFKHFELHNITVSHNLLCQYKYPVHQFGGILDKNMKEIYEEDVVTFKTDTKTDIGVVRYVNDYCSYVAEVEQGYSLFANISFDSLEIVGNMIEDYMYDENGRLIKNDYRTRN